MNFRTYFQLVVVVVLLVKLSKQQVPLTMPTVFYCCSFLIWQAKVFLWIFSKQKQQNRRKIFLNEKQKRLWPTTCHTPTATQTSPATLSQEFSFALAMLSFVICVFHENMRYIRSYIVSLYICVYIGTPARSLTENERQKRM